MAAKKRVSSRNLSQLSPAEKQIYERRMQTSAGERGAANRDAFQQQRRSRVQGQLSPAERQVLERQMQTTSGERGAARQAAFEKQRIARSRRIGLPKLPEAAPQATAEPATRPPTRPTTLAGKAGKASAQAERGMAQAGRAIGRGARVAGKIAAPIALATEAVRAVNLATDPEAVQEAAAAYDDLADSNSFMRAVEGGLMGLDSIAGYAEQAKGMRQSMADAERAMERSEAALNAPEGIEVQREAARRRSASRQFGNDQAEQLFSDLQEYGEEGLEAWKMIRNSPEAMANYAAAFYAEDEPEMAEPEIEEPDVDLERTAELREETERLKDQLMKVGKEPEMAETPAESKPRRKSPPRAEYEPAPEEEPEAAPPKAIPVAPEDDETLSTLFKTATGTSFDPKSSRDADYMKKVRETLAEQGGLGNMTPTQFALKLYRKYD